MGGIWSIFNKGRFSFKCNLFPAFLLWTSSQNTHIHRLVRFCSVVLCALFITYFLHKKVELSAIVAKIAETTSIDLRGTCRDNGTPIDDVHITTRYAYAYMHAHHWSHGK